MMQSTIATLGDDYHTSVSTRAHKNNYFNIVYALHLPSSMWRAKVFADSSSSSSDSSYHVRKGNEVPLWLQQVTKCKRERKALLKGEKRELPLLVFLRIGVPITIATPNHTRAALCALSSDTLPHHVLRAGAVKQASLYSGFIQHQSSSLLFFRRY